MSSSSPTFVAFDIETTGLIAGVDRIVEVAAVAFREDAVLETFTRLVDPGLPIPEPAERVNGITDEMVRGCPPIAEALPGFLSVVREGIPVAHNALFDVSFLCADIEAAGLDAPAGPVLDTRGLARRAFPGGSSYGLQNLVREHRLPPGEGPSHRALADAYACRALFRLCLGRLGGGKPPSVADLVEWSGRPLEFGVNAPRAARHGALLREAIVSGGTVEIEYLGARGERTLRRISPLSFRMQGGAPAVAAFCHLRGRERTFLIDSIADIRTGT